MGFWVFVFTIGPINYLCGPLLIHTSCFTYIRTAVDPRHLRMSWISSRGTATCFETANLYLIGLRNHNQTVTKLLWVFSAVLRHSWLLTPNMKVHQTFHGLHANSILLMYRYYTSRGNQVILHTDRWNYVIIRKSIVQRVQRADYLAAQQCVSSFANNANIYSTPRFKIQAYRTAEVQFI